MTDDKSINKKVIQPGNAVRNSQSGQPIMVALDLLGRRWALRILWELRHGDTMTSRMLQKDCEISSPNVLTSRLRELREANIVGKAEGGGYHLTEEGKQLLQAIAPLAEWADRWASNVGRDDLTCYSKSQK
jgi:DNA-binding HxlR family transcriptional regulator